MIRPKWAGEGIERKDLLARIEIHRAADHERRALGIDVPRGIADLKRPRALKLGDVVCVDLRKRGVD
jgi:hypothetical protein